MITQNLPRYINSLSQELAASANRVRDLIGDAHWLSDGHHKEGLLATALSRHLPKRLTVTTGFLLGETDTSACSREQDILLLDLWNNPLLFGTERLSVSYSVTALACISVKTQLKKDTVVDSWNTLASVPTPPARMRRVAFFFDNEVPEQFWTWIKDLVSQSTTHSIDYIATTGDLFARIDRGQDHVKIRGFSTDGMSFGFLLATLLTDLTDGPGTATDELVADIERLPSKLLFEEDIRL